MSEFRIAKYLSFILILEFRLLQMNNVLCDGIRRTWYEQASAMSLKKQS